MSTVLFRASLALAVLGSAVAAHASIQAQLTLDNPFVFTLPTTGTQTCTLTGTITAIAGYAFTSGTGAPLLGPGGSFTPTLALSEINAGLASSGTYKGPILRYTFSSATLPGSYSSASYVLNTGPGIPSTSAAQAVTLISPVPEPSAFAALGLGAAALLRRRKRA